MTLSNSVSLISLSGISPMIPDPNGAGPGASIVGRMSETPESTATASKDDDCATCMSGRAITLAVVFGLFAAYCAADFATGGRLTTWLAAMVASARGGSRDS